MQAHALQQTKKGVRRIGRGGKRGSFSGHGIKGQKSRAGRRIRPQVRDILKKIHKRRGHGKNRPKSVVGSRLIPVSVSMRRVDAAFDAGERITKTRLIQKNIIRREHGKVPAIKIIGGKSAKKLTFAEDIITSKSVIV
jgi:large subunit ribosomal protein L15